MHILLVGHACARSRLLAIANALRSRSGVVVNCYFDHDLEYLNKKRELPSAEVLVIGLSRISRQKGSPEHAIEEDIVQRASALTPPMRCCIVCDEDGHVSAPFLIKLGSKVELVVTHEQNLGCNITEMCERAKPLYIRDIAASANEVANEICELVARTATAK